MPTLFEHSNQNEYVIQGKIEFMKSSSKCIFKICYSEAIDNGDEVGHFNQNNHVTSNKYQVTTIGEPSILG